MPLLPYREVTDPSYADAYTAGLRVSDTRDGAVLSGSCPRCACPFDFSYTRRVFRYPRPGGRSAPAVTVPVLCVCEAPHEGRPADEEGCGAYWNVVLERSP
ncbi:MULTISPECIES: hypothetical protein [unclassified Streptomyces]|uniref:hypothetical protein n=1 Tax=unclassified Streptomyces TaxID=2593676 RepID=UPI002E33DC46|nr:hypothetical protein [Streptomyces sp. NBC_01268]